jgi:hypothetical protein
MFQVCLRILQLPLTTFLYFELFANIFYLKIENEKEKKNYQIKPVYTFGQRKRKNGGKKLHEIHIHVKFALFKDTIQ